jgi:5-methylcytosine-specific restriction endonuclease McrA
MKIQRPCLTCGEPTPGTYCARHAKTSPAAVRSKQRHAARDPKRFGEGWSRKSKLVLERDGYQCQIGLPGCTGRATTADHIIAVAKGGSNDVSNLQAACRHCNSVKGKH